MSMSRKDYVEAAKIVAAARVRYNVEAVPQYEDIVNYFETELASMFAQDSSRFDARRFAAACNAELSKPVTHKQWLG
jgi:hypothetical protein